MKKLLSTLFITFSIFYSQSQCTVTLDPSTVRVTQDSTIATNIGATQFYLVEDGVTLTYNGTQSADVTYYLEQSASVISMISHEAILYMKANSSIDANYSQGGQWAITDQAWYDPTATFEDYIQGQNFNECAQVTFIYNGTSGLSSNEETDYLSIFPNPACSKVSIETGSNAPKTIIISNVLGKSVKHIENTLPTTEIDVSSLNAGTYFVTIKNDQGTLQTKKLILRD